MNYVDEIIKRCVMAGGFTEENIRIILNDYSILPRESSVIPYQEDKRNKAVQMFFVTKKIEGCTDRTMKYYSIVIKRFLSEIYFDLEKISTDHIRYYLAIRSTRDKLSKVSQDNELRVLKSFFKWCSGEGYITKNPAANIKAIKKEARIKKPFSEIELEMIRKSAKSKRDSAIIEVLYSTGVRVSELCAMNRNDINDDEILVFGKGEKERIVYLNAKAKIAVKEYLDERTDDCEALFVSARSKKRLQPGSVESLIRDAGEKVGIPCCHPHRFRRTAATIALNRGMPLEQVQKMLGHENIQTTTIYARSDMENVKASHGKYVV